MIWKLNDLSGTVVSLFLFGESYEAHWRTYEGMVICALCPKVSCKPGFQTPSLSTTLVAQIVPLGYSQGIYQFLVSPVCDTKIY